MRGFLAIIAIMVRSRRKSSSIAALSLVLALGACGWAEWPPPGQQGGNGPRALPRIVAGEADAVTVQRGETVYGLAQRHKVPPRAIIEANALKPPYGLYAGQVLRIPSGSEHTVKTGETIYTIAQRFGVDAYDLARANGVRPPYILKVGEKLMIPRARPAGAPSSSMASRAPDRPGPSAQQATPIEPIQPADRPATAQAPASESGPESAPEPMVDGAIGGGGRLAWPVRGRVISNFGAKAKGLRNDGINIAAPRGAPVRAADAGTVAYAGNELRGFGNLLLIRHASGFVTAYAHTDQILVKCGDTVKRGQIVARVGNTGGVPSPQLHFEVRHGRRSVDPERYLEKG